MLPRESTLELLKSFTALTNPLAALGKVLTNDELNLKIFRSLPREWQPKVMVISEKNSLSKMSLATLFGKTQEREIELDRFEIYEVDHDKLEKHEGCEVKVKSIALKSKHKLVKKKNLNLKMIKMVH